MISKKNGQHTAHIGKSAQNKKDKPDDTITSFSDNGIKANNLGYIFDINSFIISIFKIIFI